MLIAAALYTLHIPINQRVLHDMPPITVTFYTLLAVSIVTVPVFILSDTVTMFESGTRWGAIIGLTLVTFLSRLTLFLGVKNIGGMQSAILGLSKILVTLALAHFWIGERPTTIQWVGAILSIPSMALIGLERTKPKCSLGGFLSWLNPPGLPTNFHWQPHD